jgi:uncharacterized protein (TIGR02300 family)
LEWRFDSEPFAWQGSRLIFPNIIEGRRLANPELGAKQICPNCQTKFYDLGRRPAVCPKCGTAFDPEEAVKSRRVRARAVTPDYDADDEAEKKAREKAAAAEEGFEDEVEETPELDEAASEVDPVEVEGDEVDATPVGGEPELGVDYEEAADLEEEGEDVPFLEEEEEDDFGDDDLEGMPEDGEEP